MRDALGTGGHDLEHPEWHVSASGELPRASQRFCWVWRPRWARKSSTTVAYQAFGFSRRDSGFGFILVDAIVLLAR